MDIRLSEVVETVRITAVGALGKDGKITLFRFELESIFMANNPAIAAFAATVNANFDKVKTGIVNLDNQINAFNNSPGTLSPDDQAALDAIVTASGALAEAANAPVVPATPVVPA